MRNRKNVIMILLCIVGVFMATGYAILSTKLSINGTSTLTGSWGIRITSITSSATGRAYNISDPTYQDTSMTFEVGVKEPGDKMTFTVEVENFGNIGAILNSIDASASGAEGIIYSINGIQEQERLAAGAKKKFTITTEFDINATKLPDIPVKELTVKLNYIQDDDQELNPVNPEISDEIITLPTLSSKILSDNIAYADNVRSPYVNSDTGIDFSQVSSAENGQGLYYTNKNTDGGKTTYYFRGDVKNNYVTIGEDVYREKGYCVPKGYEDTLDEDNEFRYYLVNSNATTKEECEAITDACVFKYAPYLTDVNGCEAELNEYGEDAIEYVEMTWVTVEELVSAVPRFRIVRINEDGSVRLMSTTGISSNFGIDGDSINGVRDDYKAPLQNWFNNNLAIYSSNLISNNFCFENKVISQADTGTNITYTYESYDRLANKKSPKFGCSVAKDGGYVDLITADEVAYSGGVYGQKSTNYLSEFDYVKTENDWNSDTTFILGTIFKYSQVYDEESGDIDAAVIATVDYESNHFSDDHNVSFNHTLFPVINVKGDVKVVKGNGTSGDPYILKLS